MGSIFKFGPEGGTIIGAPEETPLVRTANPNPTDLYRPAPENQWFVYGYHNLRVIGAQWQFHGISPTPAQYQGVTHVERCVCTGARFDIDGFDRIVVPDTLRKQMVMLDSNGNVIARYGQYGNYDTPVEQIGLGSPGSVAAGDLCAFIYDDQRVVKVRYSYAAEESINIR